MTKILVVDNEKDICDFAVRFFEERNFIVSSTTNARHAIQAIEKEYPHIVLLELEMKDMSGLEVLKHIRNIKRNIRVIVLSSTNNIKAMNEAKRLGAVAYLTKPVSLSELMDIISQNLGKVRRFFELKRMSKNG